MRTRDQPQWQLGSWACTARNGFASVRCSRQFLQSFVAPTWKFHAFQEASANCCGHRTLLHFACVVGKICELFNPSLCRCGAFECRPLAQIAICGMRQLNCGSSSRFRIRLAQMWVKTNRTKTAPMDISNIGRWLTF